MFSRYNKLSYKIDDYPLLFDETMDTSSVITEMERKENPLVVSNELSSDVVLNKVTPQVNPLFSSYNTDATANMQDDLYAKALTLQSLSQKSNTTGVLPFKDTARLTNSDFYVNTGIPLVAGSIGGKVIGSQLIIGGGEAFAQFPWASVSQERNRLQNIIANAMIPPKEEELNFTNPSIPDVDGRYAPQVMEAWNAMQDRYFSAASAYGIKGINSLGKPGTPLNKAYTRDQNNILFAAKNINDVLKVADDLQKRITDKSLQVDDRTNKDMRELISGSVSVLSNGSLTYDLHEKLKDVQYGIGVAEIGKTIKESYFRPIDEILKKATEVAANGDYATYGTLLKTVKTEMGIDGMFPDGKNWDNSTKAEIEEAQRKKAESLVTPLLQSSFGTAVPDEVLKRSVDYVYNMFNSVQKTIQTSNIGSRKPTGNSVSVNVNSGGHNPVPGSLAMHLSQVKNNGRVEIGSVGSTRTRIFRTPSGDVGTQAIDKNGSIIPNTTTYSNGRDADNGLNNIANSSSNTGYPKEDMAVLLSTLSTRDDKYEALASSFLDITSDGDNYESWIMRKYSNKSKKDAMAEAKKLSLMSEYFNGTRKSVIPINNSVAIKINFNQNDKIISFTDEQGNTFMPSSLSNQASPNSVSTGNNTVKKDILSKMPTSNLTNAYGVIKGSMIVVYSDMGDKGKDSDDIVMCEYPAQEVYSLLQNSFFSKGKTSNQMQTSPGTYNQTRTSSKIQDANFPKRKGK